MDPRFFDKAEAALPECCRRDGVDLAIVLGSGWGDALCADETFARIPYAQIPGMGETSVAGHSGELLCYRRHGKKIIAFCGRRHWYEGVGWETVVMNVELARRAGAGTVLLTNASGGLNPALKPGEFVILRDHINTVGVNPLIGPVVEGWGPRFPDMSETYTPALRKLLHASARKAGLRVIEGVYAFTSGPVFETPAEIRAYGRWGADVVGMSTVPEATFAHACGMRVAGLSAISNMAAGIGLEPLKHEDVLNAAKAARPAMAAMIDGFIEGLKI